MKSLLTVTGIFFHTLICFSQTFSGVVRDQESNQALQNVEVKITEDNISVFTDANGRYSITASNYNLKTISYEKDGYMFEEFYNSTAQTNQSIELRAKKQSTASARWDYYMQGCNYYNSPGIPNNPEWNVEFTEVDLGGSLVANSYYTRRDPSAVIQHNGKYYVWYTYCISARSTYFTTHNTADKVFPWDYCDVYYATSTDGYTWQEQGPAVTRGPAGSFDDRSVFTPEVFVHEGKYYLVYQVVQDPYIERVKNNVAMAVADSPDGPWRKLDEPILRPTNNGIWTEGSTSRLDADKKGDFDSHKVHDPCLVYYKDKFYLYYKGERMGEEQYCGQREIKWGVAIADHPEGPYVKSEYNPITNTGHEVSVWPYENGIAIIQKLDGPERGSIQFAEDGVNFEMMGTASHVPDALGIARIGTSTSSPQSGVTWGLCHVLRWDIIPGGWMYLKRFDLVSYNVSSVDISLASLSMKEGTSNTLNYTVLPAQATNKNVSWSSNNNSVATVTSNGTVNAISEGTAIVTVTTEEGRYTDNITINVQKDDVITTTEIVEAEHFTETGSNTNNSTGGYLGVHADGDKINFVNSGDWATYNLNISTSGVYEIVYNISTPMEQAEISSYINDELVAKDAVLNNGQWDSFQPLIASNRVTLQAGSYTYMILASGTNEWQWNLDKITFNKIEDISTDTIDVTGVTINSNTTSIVRGSTLSLSANVEPSNATDKSVQWSSDNSNIASVNADGEVTAVNIGSANIYVITNDGQHSDNIAITVTSDIIDVTGVSLAPTAKTIEVSDIFQLTESIEPSNATNKNVTWSSANANIASVNNSGEVTGNSIGTTTIIVTTQDKGFTAKCVVTVQEPNNETIVIQAEDFVETGGTYNGFQIYDVNGVTAINWNQTGDWGDYSVYIPQDGSYKVEYFVSTPMSSSAIEFILNGSSQMIDFVPSNGNWDVFESLISSNEVNLSQGWHTIRLLSAGTVNWEWNIDRFELTRMSAMKNAKEINNLENELSIFPNPASEFISINGLAEEQYYVAIYNLQGIKVMEQYKDLSINNELNIQNLPSGSYIINIANNNYNKSVILSITR